MNISTLLSIVGHHGKVPWLKGLAVALKQHSAARESSRLVEKVEKVFSISQRACVVGSL